jgi:bacteriorhodopsin
MGIIQYTAGLSLFVQIITGLIDYYVLALPTSVELKLLHDLLLLEFIVQMIEGSFYIWLVFFISSVKNITLKRYWDWFITTPTMLITLSTYLVYLNLKARGTDLIPTFGTIISENFKTYFSVVVLNTLMLVFGYLGELNIIPLFQSVFLGFIPFFMMFYIIYENFAKHTEMGTTLLLYFFIVWSLYGVAACLSYKVKNIFYNILDLFAKNVFGLFLAYVLYSNYAK